MTPLEKAQEAGNIILNSFYSELNKTSGLRIVPKGTISEKMLFSGRAVEEHAKTVEQVNKLHAQEKVLKGVAEKGVSEADGVLKDMPVSAKTVDEVEQSKKKVKDYATAAGVLGLGGLGFGYYQYNKNKQNDQLGRANP